MEVGGWGGAIKQSRIVWCVFPSIVESQAQRSDIMLKTQNVIIAEGSPAAVRRWRSRPPA